MKGAPNLTLAYIFLHWVNEKSHVQICQETARLWLHKMSFSYRQFRKGIYFDGHEHEDVEKHRNEYLATIASLQDRVMTSPSQYPAVPPIISAFHDESTFYASADQSYHWSEKVSRTGSDQTSLMKLMNFLSLRMRKCVCT